MALGGWAATAQEIVSIPALSGFESRIVRQYKDSVQSIHYVRNGLHSYFVVYDIYSVSSALVNAVPDGYEILDFECYDDTVYFCGAKPNNGDSVGFVGFIPGTSLTSGTGNYTIGEIDNMTLLGDSTSYKFTSIDRLEIYRNTSDYRINFAVVGQLGSAAAYGFQSRRTLAKIYFNGTRFMGEALYQLRDYFRPTDIACTDQYIAAVAYNQTSPWPEVIVFDRNGGLPQNPLFNTPKAILDTMVGDNALIERVSFDGVVIAHHIGNGTAIHHIKDVATLAANLPQTFHIPQQRVGNWVLRDMRYNPGWRQLLLLHDVDINTPSGTAFMPALYEIPIPVSAIAAWTTTLGTPLTVDNRRFGRFCMGGAFPGVFPLLTHKTTASESCYSRQTLEKSSVSKITKKYPFDRMILSINEVAVYPLNSSLTLGATLVCDPNSK